MSPGPLPQPVAVRAAAQLPLHAWFDRWVRVDGTRTALAWAGRRWSYAELDDRAARLAALLQGRGVREGDRIAVLSENHPAFVWLALAAMRLGAVVATLNPRLAAAELAHALELVQPVLTMVSARHRASLPAAVPDAALLCIDDALERVLDDTPRRAEPPPPADPERPLFILYTSGTTGLPKGAVISERALAARLMVYVLDYGVDGGDCFVAWSPLCHMASIELAVGLLLLGGKVVIVDGPDLPLLCDHLERESMANLIVFPGMVDEVLAYLRQRRPRVKRLKKFGALADLFAPAQLAELTALLGVPYTNTFGSTETGMPPASAGRLAAGEMPTDLAKLPSALCELRLVDADDRDVPDGTPGELLVRGPTLFSGYWNAPEATAEVFRGGWYHTGDVFVRRADGRLEYVDRRKYLIKSGGENIYPAEIERLVARQPGVIEAVVVRRPDARWGEVPVLVVALAAGAAVDPVSLLRCCDGVLAPFKRPKRVHVIDAAALPRNGTGKIVRGDLERWVAEREAAAS
ncbi:MAG: AMP-binding protein [Rubrivivax sp.]|nr:AMP-binding protein [Rubrivivax sp.]